MPLALGGDDRLASTPQLDLRNEHGLTPVPPEVSIGVTWMSDVNSEEKTVLRG